mgnify:CR=1
MFFQTETRLSFRTAAATYLPYQSCCLLSMTSPLYLPGALCQLQKSKAGQWVVRLITDVPAGRIACGLRLKIRVGADGTYLLEIGREPREILSPTTAGDALFQ